MHLRSGGEDFTLEDLHALSSLVSASWASAADRDWSANAGTLEWSCVRTADHAVDYVYAPVCAGLGIGFEPPSDLSRRLREHTRPWPMWRIAWDELGTTDDPWNDLLISTGRSRYAT